MPILKDFLLQKLLLWTSIKLFIKNLRWTLKAKKESHLEVPTYLKDLIANVASNAAGCRYCQAHTAHTAHKNGVAIEKIQKILEFQTSDLFSEQERVALNFAMALLEVALIKLQPNIIRNWVVFLHNHKLLKSFLPLLFLVF